MVVLEKTLESLLDCKEIKPVNPKGNQPWIFIGRTDAEVEAPIIWPPDVKSQFIKKDPDAGKDWRQEEKGKTEDKMVGWHHWLNGHEFEQALGDGEGQEAWCATVHGVTKSQTWLSDWTTTIYIYVCVHMCVCVCVCVCIHINYISWSRKWQPIPLFLPGESHGQRSLKAI